MTSDFFENADLPVNVPQARPPQNTTFEPSRLLTKFLATDSTSLRPKDHRDVALKLREVVLGLLQSISDAHVYVGKTEPYQISERSRFVRSFTKAIQARIDLDPYKVGDFLTQLHRELCNSCPYRLNNWVLVCTSDGSMSLFTIRFIDNTIQNTI